MALQEPALPSAATICLITGATRGLGRAVADAMAQRGATVVVTGRDPHAVATTPLAAEFADSPIIINAVDPDVTATWPGAESMGARPIDESVPGIIWAATLPDDGPRGGFRDGKPHPW